MITNYLEKKDACVKALSFLPEKGSVGIGSGSTIQVLAKIINIENKANYLCASEDIKKIFKKRKLNTIKKTKPKLAFDGFDCIVKQGKKIIAIKGGGALDFTKEKEIDYSAKELILLGGESKLKQKCPVFVEVKKDKVEEVIKKIKEKGHDVKKVAKTNKNLVGKKNAFLYFDFKPSTNLTKLESWLDSQEGIVGNGIFSKKKFSIIIGKKENIKKTKLQVALDFDEEKIALKTAQKTKEYVDIIELGTPLVKACNEKDLIKKIKKHKKEIFVDLKTMDAGYFETKPAIKNGGTYVSVLGVASNQTIKGVLKNGVEKVVVDLICCKDVVKRIKELKKIGVKNFEIHTGIDDQGRGKKPLKELSLASEIKDVNLWVAGGINLQTLDSILSYHPYVVVIGGAITKQKNPGEMAKKISERIKELSY